MSIVCGRKQASLEMYQQFIKLMDYKFWTDVKKITHAIMVNGTSQDLVDFSDDDLHSHFHFRYDILEGSMLKFKNREMHDDPSLMMKRFEAEVERKNC
jgi:hypothetical protein